MEQYKEKSLISEITDVDVKSGIVTGYFASFNSIDSDKDMIMPGAFARTIQERGPEGKNAIFHLLQHDVWRPLGKPNILQEDQKGLYFETKIVPTTYGEDTLKLYEAEVYNEHSIGYRVISEEKILDENGNIDHYKLKEIFLWEGSTVTFGANSDTPSTGMKSENKEEVVQKLNARMDKLMKAIRVADLSDEMGIKLEIELSQLKSQYGEMIRTLSVKEPGIITHNDEPFNAASYMLNNIKF